MADDGKITNDEKSEEPAAVEQAERVHLRSDSESDDFQAKRLKTLADCPICPKVFDDVDRLQEHVNMEHFSPRKSPDNVCPLCNASFSTTDDVQEHVNERHLDIVADKATIEQKCPVCGSSAFATIEDLTEHVELHYNSEDVACGSSQMNDVLIAKNLQESLQLEDDNQLKLTEEKHFKRLQAQYGMDDRGSFKEQSIKNMRAAMFSGKLTVSELYEMQLDLKMAEMVGIDDERSCVKGIIRHVVSQSSKTLNVENCYICSELDYYSSTYGDKGWGCGYRNFQILLSSLSRNSHYAQFLKHQFLRLYRREDMPRPDIMLSISKLQQSIELAWSQGFDEQGRDQLGGRLLNTRKWIGATEVVALMSFWNIKCELIDVYRSNTDGTHNKMIEWIWTYFTSSSSFKPPLYLQHHGHSRTVIGVELLRNGEIYLLILDPSTKVDVIDSLKYSKRNYGMNMLRKSVSSLSDVSQYQIVSVTGTFHTPEESETSKVICSTKLI